MNAEKQRIKIAEACELFKIEPLRRTTRKGNKSPTGVVLWYCSEHHGGAATYSLIPDYLNDLNAMHEAEKFLACKTEIVDYGEYCGGKPTGQKHCTSQWQRYRTRILHGGLGGINATAVQRAEAFLKTLNLWEE